MALPRAVADELRRTLHDARYLVAVGRMEHVRWYRSLWAFQLMSMAVAGRADTHSA